MNLESLKGVTLNVKNDVLNQLDKIIKLNQIRNKTIRNVLKSKYKNYGRCLVELSDEDKNRTIEQVKRFYNSQISDIYKEINKQLEAAGEPLLTDLFMKG